LALVISQATFKGAEYADDRGWPWWIPFGVGTVVLTAVTYQGLVFLGL
jgi:hypothetical protein